MKNKITQLIPFTLVAGAIIYRYFSNWCVGSGDFCYGTWIHQIALTFTKPLFLFSLYSLPLAIVLALIPRDIFMLWLKRVALWAIPLALIHIALTPVYPGGYMNLYPYVRDDAARLAAGALTVVSLLYIGWKYLKSRRSNLGTS